MHTLFKDPHRRDPPNANPRTEGTYYGTACYRHQNEASIDQWAKTFALTEENIENLTL